MNPRDGLGFLCIVPPAREPPTCQKECWDRCGVNAHPSVSPGAQQLDRPIAHQLQHHRFAVCQAANTGEPFGFSVPRNPMDRHQQRRLHPGGEGPQIDRRGMAAGVKVSGL